MMRMFPILAVDMWTLLLLLIVCLSVVYTLSRRSSRRSTQKPVDPQPSQPEPQRFVGEEPKEDISKELPTEPAAIEPAPRALEPIVVQLTKEFPGLDNELIYVASEEDEDVNNFLQNLPDYIQNITAYTHLKIVYLPKLVPELIYGGAARYRHPSLPTQPPYLQQYVRNDFMLQFVADKSVLMKLKRGFLCPGRLLNQPNSTAVFLPIHHVSTVWMWLRRIFGELMNLDAYYDYKPKKYEAHGITCDIADRDIDDSQRSLSRPRRQPQTGAEPKEKQVVTDDIGQLMKEVKERVDRLRQHGVAEYILETLFRVEDKLSRLVITSDHRVLLPDYNDMEIKMEPLVKAVYLLFLRHPEGIAFKDLPDYRQELTDLYRMLRPTGLTARARASIEDVTNPLSNSINEKCARIRAAFLTRFDDRLAQHYYITGQRAEPKRITLSRELVVWE